MNVLKKPTKKSFEKVGITGYIFESSNLINSTQFVLIETDTGHATSIIEHKCDFSYYVLEGSGYFIIDGNKETCGKGDLVIVPAGKKFTYKGNLKMLLNVTPPWTEEQEESFED